MSGFRKAFSMDIKVGDTLWGLSMLPEGIVERWRVENGAVVAAGQALVDVRIEDALHEIVAPAGGRLTISAAANCIVEPGSLLGHLECRREPMRV
jgi:pyruvate/2-oxoglutarate dehydrogenase complex dihydrolipoamide acyltransferase (E2) component